MEINFGFVFQPCLRANRWDWDIYWIDELIDEIRFSRQKNRKCGKLSVFEVKIKFILLFIYWKTEVSLNLLF